MSKNDTKLMESVIALAEELHFGRAARRLRISQPMLTKNIQDVEVLIGGSLFVRDRKHVLITDAGRAYVEHARHSLLYGERAVQAARSVLQELDMPLYVGRSPYIDPFLVSTLLSIHLPLFPRLRMELVSKFSVDLANDLLDGELDLAIATEPPDSAQLSRVQVSEEPFYIAVSKHHKLAQHPSVTLSMMADLKWILFERRLHTHLYDKVLLVAEREKMSPKSIAHVTSPEEAFPFVADGAAVAFVVKPGALLLARNGVTVRPLICDELVLKTYLVSRADNETKIASELVRAYMRKMIDVKKDVQLRLPIYA